MQLLMHKENWKQWQKGVLHYIQLTNQLWLKIKFQKVDQFTGGMWLIHGTKYHKDNLWQNLELP